MPDLRNELTPAPRNAPNDGSKIADREASIRRADGSTSPSPSLRELSWMIAPALLLITIRLALWHQYFDPDVKTDRPLIDGREAATGMHCANDRSRWAAVVSLVHQGTWQIDEVEQLRGSNGNWGTIDKVYHMNRSGTEHFYSSKPPLYILFVASQYWILNRTFGVDMLENPLWAIKGLVFFNQVLLFGIFLWLYIQICYRFVTNRRVLICLVFTAGFGTFLSTFAVSLNNHLPAAVCVLTTIVLLIRIENASETCRLEYFFIGITTALSVTFDLPALSFAALIGVWLLALSPTRTLTYGLGGVGLIAMAFFGSNYWAHESLRPPYAHRSDGIVLEYLDQKDAALLVSGVVPETLSLFGGGTAREVALPGMSDVVVEQHPSPGRWRIFDLRNNRRYALQQSGSVFEIRAWDNWYDYEVNGRPSYWLPGVASGVDLGEPSRRRYLMHMTIGHHGIFSLSPIWLFSLLGIVVAWHDASPIWRRLAYISLTLTVVLIVFYTMRPLADRNYGGVSSGFRWFFWMTPLFLLMLIPAWKVIRKSVFLISLWTICLGISVYSGLHGFLNPWQHPWFFNP